MRLARSDGAMRMAGLRRAALGVCLALAGAAPAAAGEASRAVATLFGQPITAADVKLESGEPQAAGQLRQRVLKATLERFVTENGLDASEADFAAYARFEAEFRRADLERRRKLLAAIEGELGGPTAPHLSEAQRTRLEQQRETLRQLQRHDAQRAAAPPGQADQRRVLGPWIAGFKAGKALHERYGGVVGMTKFGPEPSGAIVALLREHEQAGRLHIAHAGLRAAFWALVERPPRVTAQPGRVDFTYYWLKPVPRD